MKTKSILILSLILLFTVSQVNANGPRNITIIGAGYVGLIMGAALADFGNQLTIVDIDRDKIQMLQNGKMPLYEPGLEELIKRGKERIFFTTNISSAIKTSEIIFITVGTPPKENGEADTTALDSVLQKIAEEISDYKLICIKSTVPAGTNKRANEIFKDWNVNPSNFDIVSNPEFLREGCALNDLYNLTPIVVGSDSDKAIGIIRDLYEPLLRNPKIAFIYSTPASAELIKYSWNAFSAIKLAYVNELAALCKKLDADIFTVLKGVGFGDNMLPIKKIVPGPGYGGSCLPKDTLALIAIAFSQDSKLKMVEAAVKSNEIRKKNIYKQVVNLLGRELNNKRIAILGLSFKANTDDIRNSPALLLLSKLVETQAQIIAHDPVASKHMQHLFPSVSYTSVAQDAVDDADMVILLTEWPEYKSLQFKKIAKHERKFILDTRYFFDSENLKSLGYTFIEG